MLDDFADRCLDADLGPVGDAGCGAGRVAAHRAARGVEVFGVDLSPGMVAAARAAHPHLRFEVSAMEDLPASDASLGGLLAWYSPARLTARRGSRCGCPFDPAVVRHVVEWRHAPR